jgi:hypothetical protein
MLLGIAASIVEVVDVSSVSRRPKTGLRPDDGLGNTQRTVRVVLIPPGESEHFSSIYSARKTLSILRGSATIAVSNARP